MISVYSIYIYIYKEFKMIRFPPKRRVSSILTLCKHWAFMLNAFYNVTRICRVLDHIESFPKKEYSCLLPRIVFVLMDACQDLWKC